MVNQFDHIIVYQVIECTNCGQSLEYVLALRHETRQVFDLPPNLLKLPNMIVRSKLVRTVTLSESAVS